MEFLKHSKSLTNGRRITVAAYFTEDSRLVFGMSVCKPGEPFNKKMARARAFGLAKSKTPATIINVLSPDRSLKGLSNLFHETAKVLVENKDQEIELRLLAANH